MARERATSTTVGRRRFIDRATISLTMLIATGCVAMFGACLLYSRCADSLHDTRFLTGWVLALTLGVLCFPRTLTLLRAASNERWLKLHLATWAIGVVAFGFHIESQGPNTPFEYALSALFGVYAVGGLALAGLWNINRKAFAGEPARSIEDLLMDWITLGERVEEIRAAAPRAGTSPETSQLIKDATYRMSLRPRSGIRRFMRPISDSSPLTIRVETVQRIASNTDRDTLKRLSEAMADADTLEARFTRRLALRRATFAQVFVTGSLITLGMMHGTLLSAHGYMAHVFLGK